MLTTGFSTSVVNAARNISSRCNKALGLDFPELFACDTFTALEEYCDYDDIRLHRPPASYVRIDSMLASTKPEWLKNNAFHGTLSGQNMIEDYEVYFNPVDKDIVCLVRFGGALNGHEGIVHGGITAMTFDNSFGWLFMANKCDPAFTANINVNYRRKVLANSLVLLRAKFTEVKGRKLFMGATMEDTDGNILADATCLFITVKDVKKYKGSLPDVKK